MGEYPHHHHPLRTVELEGTLWSPHRALLRRPWEELNSPPPTPQPGASTTELSSSLLLKNQLPNLRVYLDITSLLDAELVIGGDGFWFTDQWRCLLGKAVRNTVNPAWITPISADCCRLSYMGCLFHADAFLGFEFKVLVNTKASQ